MKLSDFLTRELDKEGQIRTPVGYGTDISFRTGKYMGGSGHGNLHNLLWCHDAGINKHHLQMVRSVAYPFGLLVVQNALLRCAPCT